MIISPYCYCSDLDDASFIYVLTTVILFHNIILLHGICWPCVHVCNTLLDKARLQGELRDTNLSVWSSKTVPSFSFIILFVIRQIISSWVGWSFINSVATKEWPSRQRKTSVEKKKQICKTNQTLLEALRRTIYRQEISKFSWWRIYSLMDLSLIQNSCKWWDSEAGQWLDLYMHGSICLALATVVCSGPWSRISIYYWIIWLSFLQHSMRELLILY